MNLFKTLLIRECILSYRHSSDYFLALSFWLLVVCFFPLTNNAHPALLQAVAPGIIWLGLLLTQLLNLPKLFREDYQEGILAELIQSPSDFFLITLYKLFTFWLIHFLPIFLLAPFIAIMMHLSTDAMITLELTLLLGSPTLILLGAFVASLTLSIKHNTLLMNILYLPLTVPILIFSTGAVNNSSIGLPHIAPLAWLGVILLLSFIVLPVSICTILKSIE